MPKSCKMEKVYQEKKGEDCFHFMGRILECNECFMKRTVAKFMEEVDKTGEVRYGGGSKPLREIVTGKNLEKHDDVINAFSSEAFDMDKNTLLNLRSESKVFEIVTSSDGESESGHPKSINDKIYLRSSIISKLAKQTVALIDESESDELESERNMKELSVALNNVSKLCSTLVYENYSKKLTSKMEKTRIVEEEMKMEKKINLIKAILCFWEKEMCNLLSKSEANVQDKEWVENLFTLSAMLAKTVQDKLEATEEYDKFSEIVKSELSASLKKLAFENYVQNGFKGYDYIYSSHTYSEVLITLAYHFITQLHPEFSLEDLSGIEMFDDPSKYAYSIREATFKNYKALIELYEFITATYRDDSERKEQAIEWCENIEYKGEEWVLWEPQDRYLVQASYALFVNTLEILSKQEFCECLDICPTVLDAILYVELETYLLPEKSVDAENSDCKRVNIIEDNLDELYDEYCEYCDGDFDEDDFKDKCEEIYYDLVGGFNLGDNISTCNRRYIIKKAYEFFVEQTNIITEDQFAKDLCFYSDNDSCDIIGLFELEIQTV